MKLNPCGPSMTEIEIGDKTILFSYKTPVAYRQTGVGYVKTSKRWSATTTRHINKRLQQSGFDASRGDRLREIDQSELDGLV